MGINCKYNGGNNENKDIIELGTKFRLIPVCPEQLGGCTTPRLAAEIQSGDGKDVLDGTAKVQRIDGSDVSSEFIKGAQEVLKIAKQMNINIAILKARSPSCGVDNIYDGTFSGKLKSGNGVTAEILKRNGIKVITEEEIEQLNGIIDGQHNEIKTLE